MDTDMGLTTELAPAPWQPEHLLLRVGLAAQEADRGDMPPSSIGESGARSCGVTATRVSRPVPRPRPPKTSPRQRRRCRSRKAASP